MRWLWLLVALFPAGLWAAGPPAGHGRAPRAGSSDARDLVLMTKARPYLLRMHLQVRGRPYAADYDATVAHLFRFLDADGDGLLSKAELGRAPSVTQWRQMLQGARLIDPDPAPDFAVLAEGKKGVSLAAFQAYYRHSPAGALQVDWGTHAQAADPLTDTLFRLLDRDKDGKLSRAELLDAPRVFNKFDANADEMVTPLELGTFPLPPPVYTRGSPSGPAAGGLPLFLRGPGEPAAELASRLLAFYDRNKDGKLDRKEIGVPPALFDILDRNRDGQLDAAELAAWPEQPPDLELTIALEPGARRVVTVHPGGAEARALAAAVRRTHNGSLLLPIQDWQVELVVTETTSAARRADRESAARLFRSLDANNDGYLDSREIYQPPFAYVALLRLADRDGDGKISRKEFLDYYEVQSKVNASTTFLTIADRGRRLFAILDADGDGRLSQREMRTAWTRLAPWVGDGTSITRGQVPRHLRIALSHGRPPAHLADVPGFAGSLPRRSEPRLRGPLWFRKMDRNRDGDVSRSEFLGTEEQFRRIDTDGDGLISVEEAERADAWFRKQRGK
jgi:Ca2+-binding EF-hand superfamily protein